MKTFLNWILLVVLVMVSLGTSPLAQEVVVTAQAEKPPVFSESPEPLILPFLPNQTSSITQPIDMADAGTSEPPAMAPFLLHLETLCDAGGQTARLSWSLTGELGDRLDDKSELLVKLPAGLQPLEGMEITPDGLLHLPANREGQAVFSIRPETSESSQLDAWLTTAETEQAAATVAFVPGAYARLAAEGGRVDAKALGVSVDFPEKVLPTETAICIGPVTEVELPTSLSGRPFQLNAYDVEKGEEITKFEQDLKVQVSYGEDRYSGKESQLMLFYYNQELQDWGALPTEVDEESNSLTGYTNHFTPFDIKPQSWESARLPTLDGFAVSDFTGAAAYSYPIQLPPGAGGWQPSLALTYNSQVVDNANSVTQASWVGMGWSLNTGYIQRNMGDITSFYGARDPNCDVACTSIDNDLGHDGDDTFSLVLNGQSWQLLRLPDQDSNTETIEYRTENESFWRIRRNHAHINAGYVTDNSTWEVWDKTGNKYTFSPEARYPIGCYSPFMLVWQWPLTLAQTAMDLENPNVDYSITYTYAFEQEARRNGIGCDGAFTQVAVYPATISYSGYQVVFDRSARYDHKAAWDTYPDKEYQSIFFEQSRLAAIRILSQNGSNWELVRKYILGYQDGLIFPNLIWDANVTGSKTPTLVSITEYGSDGGSSLPATTFSYDGMHLVSGSNGYGGSVEFDYEGASNRPWYEFQTTQASIQGYSSSSNQVLPFGEGLYGDTSIYDPGQMYKIELKIYPTTAVCVAGYYYGVHGSYTYEYATLIEQELPNGVNYKYMRWASFVTLNAKSPRFFFSCTGGGNSNNEIRPFYAKAWPLVNRYRVTAKTVSESQNNTSSTTSYTYTGTSTNNPTQSPQAGTYPYTDLRTEYRGNNSMTQIAPQGLATTSWFGQKDDYSGLPLAQMTALQQVYDDFDALDTGVWSYSHYGIRQLIVKEEGEPVLKMDNALADWSTVMVRNQPTLQDGESEVIQFKLSAETAEIVLAITTASPDPYERWGVYIHNDANNNHYAQLQYKTASSGYQNETLIEPGDFQLETWYVLMLTAGAEEFSARIWQRDNPALYYEYTAPFTSGKNWQYVQYVNSGTLYLEDFREGPVYGLQLTNHGIYGSYTPPTIIPPKKISGPTTTPTSASVGSSPCKPFPSAWARAVGSPAPARNTCMIQPARAIPSTAT